MRGPVLRPSLVRRWASSSATARANAGKLYVCGTAEANKLGLADQNDREVPTLVPHLEHTPVLSVACGKFHTVALAQSGDVYAWGSNESGQLGLGHRSKVETPTKVESLSGVGVTALACGLYHTLALTDKGDVLSCGFGGSFWNGAGALGQGDRSQLDTPKRIVQFGTDAEVVAKTIAAGGYHSMVLDADNQVWTWGRGEWGRLGLGDSSDALTPQQMYLEGDTPPRVAAALTGESHSAIVGAGGEILLWGRNEHWQLGAEVSGLLNSGQSFDAQQEPHVLKLDGPEGAAGDAHVVKATCGEMGTAVLLSDGNALIWGLGRYYEPTKIPNFKELIGDDSISQLELGGSQLAVRTASGAVYTFGSGTALGHAKVERKSWELQRVSSLADTRVSHVACGSSTTAFIVEE